MIFISRINEKTSYRDNVVFILVFLVLSTLHMPLLASERCIATDTWFNPATGATVDEASVLTQMQVQPVILLGEHHQNAFHHDWHVAVLKRLNQSVENFEIALEMLPVNSQPVIDKWQKNEISDEVFIKDSGWDEYWSHDVNLYMPMLQFAKNNRIPLHAINVSEQLFRDVSQSGWAAIEETKREGVSNPGAASRDYLVELARSFRRHGTSSAEGISQQEGERFKRFIDVQLLWDRAMAEGIARVRKQANAPTVVAIMGSGHMMHGYGTPHQLKDMGLDKFIILVPWDDHLDCSDVMAGFADLVYGTPPNLE